MTPSRRIVIGAVVALIAMGAAAPPVGRALVRAAERRPDRVAAWVGWASGLPDGALSIGGVAVDLERGRFTLDGLRVAECSRDGLVVRIDHLEADVPSLAPLLGLRIDLGAVQVDGLAVSQRWQGRGLAYVEPVGRTLSLTGDVTVQRGAFAAAADAGRPGVQILDVSGRVDGFRWVPARLWYEGVGRDVRARSMRIGDLQLGEVHVPVVALEGDAVELGPTSVWYSRAEATVDGRVSNLRQRADVELRVRFSGESLSDVVRTATGVASPVRGRISASMTLRSGGGLPVGGVRFQGWAAADDVSVHLGAHPGLVVRNLIGVAPWFQLEDDWVSVGDLSGEVAFGRGWVEVLHAERSGDQHGLLQAWGAQDGDQLTGVVRMVPRHADRRGIGIAVGGTARSPRFRLAPASALEDAPPVPDARAPPPTLPPTPRGAPSPRRARNRATASTP